LVIGLMGFTAIKVTATLPSLGVETPQRDCTVSVIGGSVKIQAGPDGMSPPVGPFPIPDPCPSTGEDCLKWTYKWTVTGAGLSLSKVGISVDTDITIFASSPAGATIDPFIPFVAEGERLLRYSVPGTPTTFTASFWTPAGVGPGTLTAGVLVKKGFLFLPGRCALAGADNQVTQTRIAVTTKTIDQAGPCTLEITKDAQGCTVQIIVLDESEEDACNVFDNVAVSVGGFTPHAISCDTKITAPPGDTRFCYPKPTGSMICVGS
jgi:hypothetical protein